MIFGLFVCGLLSGITTWLFGFGGGFVTVPLLYLLLSHQGAAGGQAMQIAVATSALVMLCTSLLASGRHLRVGTVHWRSLLPILGGIAIGGIAGAALALRVNGEWIRWLFILYLAVTMVDCYVRPGFMAPSTACAPSSAGRETILGGGIGLIAAFLGVGGSVMTVPLMRRRGATMAQAAAMANLLTLPLAATASLTWLLMAPMAALPSGFIGNIWWLAAGLLVAGSWLGLRGASRWLAKLPDRWHVRIYPLLLLLVLLAMCFGGVG